MSGPYFTDEEWEEKLKKTNQQVTANHTVKMFNQSRTQMTLDDYYKRILNPAIKRYKKETKMTRKEAIELARKFGNVFPYYEYDIKLLEALDLIKFLDKHGYKIVKK